MRLKQPADLPDRIFGPFKLDQRITNLGKGGFGQVTGSGDRGLLRSGALLGNAGHGVGNP